jgi:hypothetical protein
VGKTPNPEGFLQGILENGPNDMRELDFKKEMQQEGVFGVY